MDKKLITAIEVPPLEGKTDAEIDEIAAKIADQIADAFREQGEEVEPAPEPEAE